MKRDEIIAAIVNDLKDEDFTIKQIADRNRVSYPTVQKLAKQHGLSQLHPRGRKLGTLNNNLTQETK